MPIHIALLGLGRLGGSLAAALSARDDLQVAGFDLNPEISRVAQSRGLLRRIEWTIPNAVDSVDLVLLAQPLAEHRETLAVIAPHLRSGCVVASLASLLGPPIEWARELLPAERYFVACHPILSPAHLPGGETGLDAARADLFAKGLWALAPGPACAPEALKLISDLSTLLGSAPYFVDPAEHDGVMGGADALPTILAWALMLTANMSSGWPEMRKVADQSFAAATAALADPALLTLNRESVLRYLDAALAELKAIRALIASDSPASLEGALTEAQALRARWLAERQQGEWDTPPKTVDIPSATDNLGRFFVGNLFKRRGAQK